MLQENNKGIFSCVFLLISATVLYILLCHFLEQKLDDSIHDPNDICVHPEVDVFDPEIMKYYIDIPKCNVTAENVTHLRDDGLLLNLFPMKYECWGRCLEMNTNTDVLEGMWTELNSSFGCDIVETRCSLKGNRISDAVYFFLHTQIIEMEIPKPKTKVKWKQYNVFFIVVDSQAHTQVFRNLNKTYSYLMNELEAIPFPYMNRLSDRSRENAIAWWFGKIVEPVDRSRYNLSSIEPEKEWEKGANCRRFLDDEESYLLKQFKEYGYVTNLAEDWYTTMELECEGFFSLGTHHTYNEKHCLHRHQPLLQYSSQFVRAYPDKPKMGWTWITHAGHNSEWGSRRADADLRRFLKENRDVVGNLWTYRNPFQLDESFLFIAGNHGMRFTDAVKTKVGRLDVNNPMLIMSLPRELREKNGLMEMVRRNAKELQTHFDTRATLLDILKYQPENNFDDQERMDIPNEWGLSFFREQPLPRTCRTLPIPPQYCICQSPIEIDLLKVNSTRAREIGKIAVQLLNKKMKDVGIDSKCVLWSFVMTETLIQFSIEPSYFEAVVAVVSKGNLNPAQFKLALQGSSHTIQNIMSFDRLDLYESTGKCVEKQFKPICQCK